MNASGQDQLISKTFAWFTGVVEDIQDPMQMGRVRVRCFGYHTDDKTQIRTEDLPWSVVMTPIHSASISGIGQSATGILQGSWVIGFFRDGISAQDAIVLGTIPSYSTKTENDDLGFRDPTNTYPKQSGVDTPQEARVDYSESESFKKRQQLAQPPVKLASIPEMSAYTRSASPEQGWAMKSLANIVKPQYPKNQVHHSESGHIKEIDDTNGSERTLEMHRTGTYVEVDAAGDKTTVVNGNDYQVVIKNQNVYIKGQCNLTVDGDLRTYVKGSYLLEVEGDKFEFIKGNRFSSVKNFDQMDSKQSVIAVDNTVTLGLKTMMPANLEGLSGVSFLHPQVSIDGNLTISSGATGGFTSVDGRNITVANGVVTNIAR